MLDLPSLLEARERVAPYVRRTPMMSSGIGEIAGVDLFLKCELFQWTGSFKARGIFNKLLQLSTAEKARGVISMSAGNAAAALAHAGTELGTSVVVVMPATAVRSKVEATRSYGAEVVLTSNPLKEVADDLQRESGRIFVHPFDDVEIMTGHAGVGLEIVEEVDTDVVIVPIGGGGLIGGVSAAIKQQSPGTVVIGVEPRAADSMRQSLDRGSPVTIGSVVSIADGLTAPFAGKHCYEAVTRFVDDVVTVSEEAIVEALLTLMTRAKLAAEPAAAASIAALTSGAYSPPTGSKVTAVISGGNIDLEVLRKLL